MAEGSVENIVKQGYLRRVNTSNNRLSGLFKRSEGNKWFVLVVRQNCPYLQQYDADVDVFSRSPVHSYNLAHCKAVRSMGSSDPPTFCVVCADRVIELVAASRNQMLDWVTTVDSCLVDLGIIKKEPVEHVYTVCPAVVRKPRVSKEVLEEREAEALRQAGESEVPTTRAPPVPPDFEFLAQLASNAQPVESGLASNCVEGASAMEARPRLPARSKTIAGAKSLSSPVTETRRNDATASENVPPPLPSRPSSYATSSVRLTPRSSLNSPTHPVADSSNDSDFVSPDVIAQLRMITESSEPPSSSHNNVSYSSSNSILQASNIVLGARDHDLSGSKSLEKTENDLNPDPALPRKCPDVWEDVSDLSSSSSSRRSSFDPSIDLDQFNEFSKRNFTSANNGQSLLGIDHSLVLSESGARHAAASENDYSLLPSENGAFNSNKPVDNLENTISSSSACFRENTKPRPHPRHTITKQDCLQDELQSSENLSSQDMFELNNGNNELQDYNRSEETNSTFEISKEEQDSIQPKDVNENCYGLIFDPSVANIPFTSHMSPTSPIPPLPHRHDSLPAEAPPVLGASLAQVTKCNGEAAPPLPLPRRSIRVTSKSESTTKDLEIPPMPPRRRPPMPSKVVSLDYDLKDKNDEDRPPALPTRPSQSFYIKRPQLMSHFNSNDSAQQTIASAGEVSEVQSLDNNSTQSGLSRMMLLDRAHSLHTVVSLKQTQAEILQSEIAMSSLTITLTQKSGHGLALVDWNGLPCVVGWNQRDFPSLHGKLHLGDQLISVNGVKVSSVEVAQKLLKGATTPKITVSLHRMPFAKVFSIRRDAEGQSLGIKREGGSGEIVYVDPNGLAAQHGLSAYASGVATELRCNWFITEINNRPISLFFKENEIEHRLAAVGREISFVVQPSDFIQEMRRQFKKIRNYKSFITQ